MVKVYKPILPSMIVAADPTRSPTSLEPRSPRAPSSPRVHYVALLLVLLLFASIRFRLRNMPLERDEGEYAYVGQLMLQGVPPYKLAFNMKLPGTYAVYAVVMALFGQTIRGIRIGMLLINALTTVLMFLLGRKVFGSLTGIVAAATYALLSNRTSLMGFDGHATHFVALTALAGTLLLLRALDTQRPTMLFASGLLYGLAFLMKQHGALLAIFGLLYWIYSRWRSKTPVRRLAGESTVLIAGIALPFLATCAIMLGTGVFRRFWFWTFSYGARYASLTSLADGWKMLRIMMPWVLRPFVISATATFGLIALLWNSDARRQGVFLVGFLLFSFLAVCPGLYFRGHYFLLILPPLALLVGVAIGAAHQSLQQRHIPFLPAWLPVIFYVLTFLTVLYGHRTFLFQMNPVQVDERIHPGDRFAEAITVASYIQSHSASQDQIAILGSEPEIYFYTRRHSATGFIYMYGLMERHKFARQMQSTMSQQIQDSRPRWMIYVDSEHSWGWAMAGAQTKDLFGWMQSYLDAHYKLAAEVPMAANPDHRWGNQAKFYIFERKEP